MVTNDPPPEAVKVIRVLYLFAGIKRKASVKEYIAKYCKKFHFKVKMFEIDILRCGRRHDLRYGPRRRKYLELIKAGNYDVVLASPPCSTFSRARWANRAGPRPLRLRQCPRGFPWLDKAHRQGLDLANLLADFATDALREQFAQDPLSMGILGHPEDLGVVRAASPPQHPGSIWHFNAIKTLLDFPDVQWGALAQSDFGTPYLKPTRLLGRLPLLEEIIFVGSPSFDSSGKYLGPLPPGREGTTMKVSRDSSGAFRTAVTAAWPPALCEALAVRIVESFAKRGNKVLKMGGPLGDPPRVLPPPSGPSPSSSAPVFPPPVPAEVIEITEGISDEPVPAEVIEINECISDELMEGLPAAQRTSRIMLSKQVVDEIKLGKTSRYVYVGRGCKDLPPSVWGNPFHIGRDGDRATVIQKFRQYLIDSGLSSRVIELKGCSLVCHCRPEQHCHADVLVEFAERNPAAPPSRPEVKVMNPKVDAYVPKDLLCNVDHSVNMDLDNYLGLDDPVLHDAAQDIGSVGRGPPRKAAHMGRSKPFADGGGLCSPGRWAPSARRFQDYGLNGLRDQLYDLFKESAKDEVGRPCSPLDFALRLSCGRYKESPFSEDSLSKARDLVSRWIGSSSPSVPAPGQSFHLELIGGLLKMAGDPDWQFFPGLASGVNLGVGVPMPRTPKVFEEKVKWRLDEVDELGVSERPNYKSVDPHTDAVEKLFKEERDLGWMIELPDDVAKKEYGDKLHIAALAVVEEPGKLRVVHDGSNAVLINHKIRPRDQTRAPGAGEVRTIMREKAEAGRRIFCLAGDVAKAHRQIKVRREDWGYQACRLRPGSVWLNKVGTYGMGSAAYFWARFAAGAQVRLGHYILGGDFALDLLLFVDDFLSMAENRAQIEACGFLIFFWLVLGFAFRWSKFKGGSQVEWVGYWMDFDASRFGVSQKRAAWLSNWLLTRAQAGSVDIKDFQAVLGRLCFAVGPLEFTRPFLAPLYAWLSSIPPAGTFELPWSICFLFRFIAAQFGEELRTSVVKPRGQDLGVAFRADAKAEGQLVVLGGWECLGGIPPARARWFSVKLNRTNAPWAFSRGEPFRCIAALELYASLLCLVVFGASWPEESQGTLCLGGVTDNLGNSFALARMMTSKFPSVVILTEFALQLRARSAELSLQWVPRDQNEEADALTNDEFGAFDPARRLDINIGELEWMILPAMLKVSEEIYQDLKGRRKRRKSSLAVSQTKTKPQERLKFRDRW